MQTVQVDPTGALIDLGVGQPDQSLLPVELLATAATHRFAHDPAPYLQYGVEPGDGYFREGLAPFVSRLHGVTVRPEDLFVTAGASQALDLISTVLVPPGSVVCVEEPSYHLALRSLRDHRFQLVGLPIDGNGLVVDELDRRLAELRPAMLYTIPTFQNPTGATLSAERRGRLVEICRANRVLLVADEVYHGLHWSAPPPDSLGAFAAEGGVLALGSFSKILAPGLRLGWIHTDPATVARLASSGLLDSGGGLNPFGSGIVRSALELGLLEPHLARLRAELARRSAALGAALRAYLPGGRVEAPGGGYFAWVHLPGLDGERLRTVANGMDVDLRPGRLFSTHDGLREFVRLSFAFYPEHRLEEGVRRLGEAVLRC
jgi:DNA-binding transcriptional MocR family regulator